MTSTLSLVKTMVNGLQHPPTVMGAKTICPTAEVRCTTVGPTAGGEGAAKADPRNSQVRTEPKARKTSRNIASTNPKSKEDFQEYRFGQTQKQGRLPGIPLQPSPFCIGTAPISNAALPVFERANCILLLPSLVD